MPGFRREMSKQQIITDVWIDRDGGAGGGGCDEAVHDDDLAGFCGPEHRAHQHRHLEAAKLLHGFHAAIDRRAGVSAGQHLAFVSEAAWRRSSPRPDKLFKRRAGYAMRDKGGRACVSNADLAQRHDAEPVSL